MAATDAMSPTKARRLTVVAQDPGVARGGDVVMGEVSVPWEEVGDGPVGHRVHVVDYDASTGTFYRPAALADGPVKATRKRVLGDPALHAQNVYALVMATLARFESALGRRVGWGFPTHQLKVVPHAFETANAFYAPDAEALVFGYFRRGEEWVFTCLSHDIVVHETAHALLHGLRERFLAPSSPDQAAFHEGYADVVALLSVFSMEEVVGDLLAKAPTAHEGLLATADATADALRSSVLLGLADDMEPEIAGTRVNALRRSVDIPPDPGCRERIEFQEAHRRGELLVAAVMRAFLQVWAGRLGRLGTVEGGFYDRGRVAEEGAVVADQLLTMVIRALDYTPPIHLTFEDFLSAVLTADTEVRADDSRYGLRDALRRSFADYGIGPASTTTGDGTWERAGIQLARTGVRFGNLQTDPTEVFRLVWANQRDLRLDPRAYTRITSVRPCLRIGPEDGLPVRETVAECWQHLAVEARELDRYGLRRPEGMPEDQELRLEGGSTFVLDEYGMLKYEVHNRLPGPDDDRGRRAAQHRLEYLWQQGVYDEGYSFAARLSTLHRRRAWEPVLPRGEVW